MRRSCAHYAPAKAGALRSIQGVDTEEPLAAARMLRVRWLDLANVIRAKGVVLPERGAADDPAALRTELDRAVSITRAVYAMPVTADEIIPATGLFCDHDLNLRPDWSTLHALPYAPGHAAVMTDMFDGDAPWALCPRTFLRRMTATAAAAGLAVRMGVELEFVLFRTDSDGTLVQADGTLFAQESAFDIDHGFADDLVADLTAQGVQVAQVHAESAGGQWEVSLQHRDPLTCADEIVVARQTIHAAARRHGLVASFLPLIAPEVVASAMHVHISFASGADGDGFGEAGWWAMAGILDHLPALTAITAPTPMSFERFRPHYWAGAYVGWGLANKEMPLRVVSAPSVAPRDVEYKALDATANPYLAFGAILAAACDGVARRADLPAEVSGDPGLLTPEQRAVAGIVPLPATLSEALDELATDSVLREAWGDELHQTYQAFKRYEADALSKLDFDDRRQLTLERY